jgi:hypothetical protein
MRTLQYPDKQYGDFGDKKHGYLFNKCHYQEILPGGKAAGA